MSKKLDNINVCRPVPVIPTVYCEELSYGEQVGKLQYSVNECIDTINEVNDFVGDIGSIKSDINKNASDISSLNTSVEKNASDISSLNTSVKKNASDISSLYTGLNAGPRMNTYFVIADTYATDTTIEIEATLKLEGLDRAFGTDSGLYVKIYSQPGVHPVYPLMSAGTGATTPFTDCLVILPGTSNVTSGSMPVNTENISLFYGDGQMADSVQRATVSYVTNYVTYDMTITVNIILNKSSDSLPSNMADSMYFSIAY